MSIAIENNGVNNKISVGDVNGVNIVAQINISGDNNIINLNPTVTGFLTINIGSDNYISTGRSCTFSGLLIHSANNGIIEIDDHVGGNARIQIMAHEPRRITVGDWCLIASEVDITVSDMHSIFDKATGERLNPAKDVFIGPHVWLGQRSFILKGSQIGQGSMIGAGAIVSSALPEYSICVGQPARAIRNGIIWDRRLLPRLPDDCPAVQYYKVPEK